MSIYNPIRNQREILERHKEDPPSLIVQLYPDYWTLNSSSKFSYQTPVASLLEDVSNHRIPVDFVELFDQAGIPFYEGNLIVELMDFRPLSTQMPILDTPVVERVVLFPTQESLFKDICVLNEKTGKRTMTDMDAFELESRILLATAPPLCLTTDPHVFRMVNAHARASILPVPNALKRKFQQVEPEENEQDKKRRLKYITFDDPARNRQTTFNSPIVDLLKRAGKTASAFPAAEVAGRPGKQEFVPLPHRINGLPTGPASTTPTPAAASDEALMRQKARKKTDPTLSPHPGVAPLPSPSPSPNNAVTNSSMTVTQASLQQPAVNGTASPPLQSLSNPAVAAIQAAHGVGKERSPSPLKQITTLPSPQPQSQIPQQNVNQSGQISRGQFLPNPNQQGQTRSQSQAPSPAPQQSPLFQPPVPSATFLQPPPTGRKEGPIKREPGTSTGPQAQPIHPNMPMNSVQMQNYHKTMAAIGANQTPGQSFGGQPQMQQPKTQAQAVNGRLTPHPMPNQVMMMPPSGSAPAPQRGGPMTMNMDQGVQVRMQHAMLARIQQQNAMQQGHGGQQQSQIPNQQHPQQQQAGQSQRLPATQQQQQMQAVAAMNYAAMQQSQNSQFANSPRMAMVHPQMVRQFMNRAQAQPSPSPGPDQTTQGQPQSQPQPHAQMQGPPQGQVTHLIQPQPQQQQPGQAQQQAYVYQMLVMQQQQGRGQIPQWVGGGRGLPPGTVAGPLPPGMLPAQAGVGRPPQMPIGMGRAAVPNGGMQQGR